MNLESIVGMRGLVTTTIPIGGLGEVRVALEMGSETFGAYAANRGMPIPTGTRVQVVEYFPPRTVVVSADQ